MQYLGHTIPNIYFYSEIQINWVSCILLGNPTTRNLVFGGGRLFSKCVRFHPTLVRRHLKIKSLTVTHSGEARLIQREHPLRDCKRRNQGHFSPSFRIPMLCPVLLGEPPCHKVHAPLLPFF